MKIRTIVAGIVLTVIGIFLWVWQPVTWEFYKYVDIIDLIGGILTAIGLGLIALGTIEALVDQRKKDKTVKT